MLLCNLILVFDFKSVNLAKECLNIVYQSDFNA